MILSYRDKRTQAFAEGRFVAAFEGFRRQAEKRLDRLEAAPDLKALRGFPGNHLEPLRGNRKGQHSIRINDQWRICFEWPEGAHGPSEVEIVDYHH
jgi:proteic killer suppression protein